eukprot:SAG11_NODE_253_length_11591_cov_15.933693_11_plen_120_part_00
MHLHRPAAADGNNVRFYLAEMSAAHPDVPFVFRLRQGPSIAAPNLNTSTKTAVAFPDGRLAFFGYSRLAADDEGPACICTVSESWCSLDLGLSDGQQKANTFSDYICASTLSSHAYGGV